MPELQFRTRPWIYLLILLVCVRIHYRLCCPATSTGTIVNCTIRVSSAAGGLLLSTLVHSVTAWTWVALMSAQRTTTTSTAGLRFVASAPVNLDRNSKVCYNEDITFEKGHFFLVVYVDATKCKPNILADEMITN